METKRYKAGTALHKAGEPVENLEYLTLGKVSAVCPAYTIGLQKCSVIGIYEQPGETYRYDYIVAEDAELASFPFRRMSDLDRIVREHRSDCDAIVAAAANNTLSLLGRYSNARKRSDNFFKALKSGYEVYRALCNEHFLDIQSYPLVEEGEAFSPDKELPEWFGDYYDQLGLMPAVSRKAFYGVHTSLTTAMILESATHNQLILKLYDQLQAYTEELTEGYLKSADLIDLYTNLYHHDKEMGILEPELAATLDNNVQDHLRAISRTGLIAPEVTDKRLEAWNKVFVGVEAESVADTLIDEALPDQADPFRVLEHSLDKILVYTSLDEAEEDRFRKQVEEYRLLNDKNSSDEEVRRLRQDITKYFFDVYDNAIVTALESGKTPPVPIRLMLYFGFMDEKLIGRENALTLLKLLDTVEKMCEGTTVYTIYDWLKAVYDGKKEPSINEFDQDYPTFLRTQRQSGFINEEQEARFLHSPRERLRFELDNFFRLGMKMASGRPSVFCPLLSEHNVIRALEDVFVTAEKVQGGWDEIKKTDYSLFYRESLYQNPEKHIPRETIIQEVAPDVILLPVIGTRGGLWQEISGVRRDTPGRMFMPVFSNEDTMMMQLKLAAEFRWAICKRVQGARWNDVSDNSLTSEYFDYLQFYRKNSELSPDAREKVKSQIQTCRNSFENVFILDYIQWIRFESKGQPRLNKVVKRILHSYCPFASDIRKALSANPMYADIINRHNIKAAKQYKLLAARYKKIQDETGSLPKEITDYIKYYTL